MTNDKNEMQGLPSETTIVEIVLPYMVNQYGTLFGGNALQFMDKAAWICATRFARKTMVTIASDRIEFKKSVPKGALIELCARVKKIGNTSVTIEVQLFSEEALTGKRELATSGDFVMVALDENGKPTSVTG